MEECSGADDDAFTSLCKQLDVPLLLLNYFDELSDSADLPVRDATTKTKTILKEKKHKSNITFAITQSISIQAQPTGFGITIDNNMNEIKLKDVCQSIDTGDIKVNLPKKRKHECATSTHVITQSTPIQAQPTGFGTTSINLNDFKVNNVHLNSELYSSEFSIKKPLIKSQSASSRTTKYRTSIIDLTDELPDVVNNNDFTVAQFIDQL